MSWPHGTEPPVPQKPFGQSQPPVPPARPSGMQPPSGQPAPPSRPVVQQPPAQSGPPAPQPPMAGTPNAEKYVLEADAMRRRQLRSALLHGSRRTWREHRRIWPAIVIGVIAAAVVVAAIAVIGAYRQYVKDQEAEEQEQDAQTSSQVFIQGDPSALYVDPDAEIWSRSVIAGNGLIGRKA